MLIGVVEIYRRRHEMRRQRRDTDKSDTADERLPDARVFLSMGRLEVSTRQAAGLDDRKACEGR